MLDAKQSSVSDNSGFKYAILLKNVPSDSCLARLMTNQSDTDSKLFKLLYELRSLDETQSLPSNFVNEAKSLVDASHCVVKTSESGSKLIEL